MSSKRMYLACNATGSEACQHSTVKTYLGVESGEAEFHLRKHLAGTKNKHLVATRRRNG